MLSRRAASPAAEGFGLAGLGCDAHNPMAVPKSPPCTEGPHLLSHLWSACWTGEDFAAGSGDHTRGVHQTPCALCLPEGQPAAALSLEMFMSESTPVFMKKHLERKERERTPGTEPWEQQIVFQAHAAELKSKAGKGRTGSPRPSILNLNFNLSI